MILRRLFAQGPISPLAAYALKRSQYFLYRAVDLAASTLSPAQKSRIALLVQATLELTEEEREVANRRVRDCIEQSIGVDPALYSDFAPKIEQSADGHWPEWKEGSFNVEKYLGAVKNIPAGVIDSVATGWKIPLMSQAAAAPAKAPAAQAAKVEAPKSEEKTVFNIVLKVVPPEAKIKLIKEVKGLMNIGLKEAKDAVESVAKQPLLVLKNIAKADAEVKMKKLVEAGGVAELQ